jgi:ubiquinone/menaquinone biosynthesis C-methylase UbiE
MLCRRRIRRAQSWDNAGPCVTRKANAVSNSENTPREGSRIWISDSDARQIRAVPHYRDSENAGQCGGVDLQTTFGWYNTHFVEQISKFQTDNNIRSVADIGTGYGWLAIAFALKGQARIVAVEYDERKLAAARQIAGIFGVAHRIEWCVASVGKLPFAAQEFDLTYCIEVIEHIGCESEVMRDLSRITGDLLVVTTPNKIFPIIHHDTSLPCCHWLPPGRLRDWYAAAFGRSGQQENNQFWSPAKLLSAIPDFERASGFLQFKTYEDYMAAEGRLYGTAGEVNGLTKAVQRTYYRAASWTGDKSVYLLPNLASIFRRRLPTVLSDRASRDALKRTDGSAALAEK